MGGWSSQWAGLDVPRASDSANLPQNDRESLRAKQSACLDRAVVVSLCSVVASSDKDSDCLTTVGEDWAKPRRKFSSSWVVEALSQELALRTCFSLY